jgi:uncharacterized delta-60 repeat protein
MKKSLLNIGLLALSTTVFGQAAGTLDKTFTTTGYSSIDFGGTNERANALALQSDGKYILFGDNIVTANTALDKAIVARYTDKGAKDATFGAGGVLNFDIGDKKEYCRDGIVLANGTILYLGSASIGTTNSIVVGRLTAAGAVDATFGTAGKYTNDNKGGSVTGRAMAVQTDGKIVAAGEANGKFYVTRLSANGAIDATFGTSGITTTIPQVATSLTVSRVIIQTDGKILVIGSGFDINNTSSICIARYNTNGTLDTTYGSGGTVETDFGTNEFVYTAALQKDGKLVLGGKLAPLGVAKYETFACRLTTTGASDITFGLAGLYRADLNAGAEEMRGMDIQSDGKIVMGGYIGDDMGLVRLATNGTIDKSFTTNGYMIIDFPNSTKDQINAVKIDKNNKIVVGGVSNYSSTTENFLIARIYSGLSGVFEADDNKIALTAFPNPTNGSLSMSYELTGKTNVTFEMYDLNGRNVAILEKGIRYAGVQNENFQLPSSISNGVYIVRMKTELGVSNVRVNVVR